MKKWTGLVGAFIVLVFIGYFVCGRVVRGDLEKVVAGLPKSQFFSFQLSEYSKGWFCSRAVLDFKMHIPAENGNHPAQTKNAVKAIDMEFKVPLLIHHGPIIWTASGLRFGMGQVTTLPETHYGVFISYANKLWVRYVLPGFSVMTNNYLPNGESQFDWRGLISYLVANPELDQLKGKIHFLGLHFIANQAEVNLSEFIDQFNIYYAKEGIWLGQTDFSFPAMQVKYNANTLFDLSDLTIAGKADLVDESLNYQVEVNLKKLFVNNTQYGPGEINLSINNLDPVVMGKINQLEMEMLQGKNNSALPLLSLMSEFPKLLAKGSELEFSQQLTLPQGQEEAYIKIALPKDGESDPAKMLQKVQGQGSFKAPIAAVKLAMTAAIKNKLSSKPSTAPGEPLNPVPTNPATPLEAEHPVMEQPAPNLDEQAQQQTEALLKTLVEKGVLKVEGDYYTVQFKIENQQFLVNGKPFDPNNLH